MTPPVQWGETSDKLDPKTVKDENDWDYKGSSNVEHFNIMLLVSSFSDMKLLLWVSVQCLSGAYMYQQTSHSNRNNWHLI